MQNRGLVKFFAILFALVSIYQLSFTFIADSVEKKAKAFANGDSAREVQYLDSVGKQEIFLGFTYNDVKNKKINKGLDLEGGINVVLEVSVRDILKGLANNSENPVFVKSLADAKANRQGNQDYLDAFFVAFKNNSSGSVPLGSPEIFGNKNLGDEVNFRMSDAEVEKVIRKKVQESVGSAFEVLHKRIDKFGVTSPNIQQLGQSGRILVELPGAKDVDRIKNLLQSTAQLEFWEAYNVQDFGNYVVDINELLKRTEKKIEVTETVEATSADSLLTGLATTDSTAVNPLFDRLVGPGGGPVLFTTQVKDTAFINSVMKRSDVRGLLPADKRGVKWAWGKPSETKTQDGQLIDMIDLYAVKADRTGKPAMSGGVVTDARDSFDELGKPVVTMQMNATGAKAWEELTGKAHRDKTFIAIVLDDVVYSAPGVTTGPISGGRSSISGNFAVTETKDLANVLRAGKLPAAAEIVQSEVVGPSLGQEAIDNGLLSAIIGALVVAAYMVFYYGRAGWFANIALGINLLFMFGILASLGAVLTLPGIAGIVLTLGTAVDQNILIYERAKEELRRGMELPDAVKSAFSWTGAMRAIVDANVAHILTGAILFMFGTGPIQGFATTLLIGIATSLFTSIFITRFLLERAISKGTDLKFYTSITKNWFTNFNFDFLRLRKVSYAVSGVIMLVCLGALFTIGLNQGVDFVGGRTYQVRFEQPVSTETVKEDLTPVLGSVEAKVFGSNNQLKITTKYKVEETGAAADAEVNQAIYEGLKKHFSADVTYDKFVNAYDGKAIGILSHSKVGPTMAEDMKTNAYWAVIGSMVLVFLYLLISFRKWQFSFAAIASVAHDVIFVLGIYALLWKVMPFSMEIDQHFVAAMLTVVGYSMNDSVIVFDRVREYLNGKVKGNFNQIVNSAINSTLSRTFNTTITLIFVLLVMFIFGGESIRGFIFAMLLGMIVGTYSSLFFATPLLCDTIPAEEHRRIEEEHNREEEVVAEEV